MLSLRWGEGVVLVRRWSFVWFIVSIDGRAMRNQNEFLDDKHWLTDTQVKYVHCSYNNSNKPYFPTIWGSTHVPSTYLALVLSRSLVFSSFSGLTIMMILFIICWFSGSCVAYYKTGSSRNILSQLRDTSTWWTNYQLGRAKRRKSCCSSLKVIWHDESCISDEWLWKFWVWLLLVIHECTLRIMEDRKGQENFQLIVITHDERFAQLIGQRQHAEKYYRVTKDEL